MAKRKLKREQRPDIDVMLCLCRDLMRTCSWYAQNHPTERVRTLAQAFYSAAEAAEEASRQGRPLTIFAASQLSYLGTEDDTTYGEVD